ncbi:MAG: hypothetical protein AAGI46_14315 [Planctomycetota bacterium]
MKNTLICRAVIGALFLWLPSVVCVADPAGLECGQAQLIDRSGVVYMALIGIEAGNRVVAVGELSEDRETFRPWKDVLLAENALNKGVYPWDSPWYVHPRSAFLLGNPIRPLPQVLVFEKDGEEVDVRIGFSDPNTSRYFIFTGVELKATSDLSDIEKHMIVTPVSGRFNFVFVDVPAFLVDELEDYNFLVMDERIRRRTMSITISPVAPRGDDN